MTLGIRLERLFKPLDSFGRASHGKSTCKENIPQILIFLNHNQSLKLLLVHHRVLLIQPNLGFMASITQMVTITKSGTDLVLCHLFFTYLKWLEASDSKYNFRKVKQKVYKTTGRTYYLCNDHLHSYCSDIYCTSGTTEVCSYEYIRSRLCQDRFFLQGGILRHSGI